MKDSESLPDNDNTDQPGLDVVFSLTEGFVWASWPGTITKIKLGSYEAVSAMMRDFLAQSEIGERLLNAKPSNQ